MPWQMRWPPYVSQRVLDDKARASMDLDQASDNLKDTIAKARQVRQVTSELTRARERNHFSESMELLFAARHHTKDTPQ